MENLTIENLFRTWKEFDYDKTYKGNKKDFYAVVIKELTTMVNGMYRYDIISSSKGAKYIDIIFDAASKFSKLL